MGAKYFSFLFSDIEFCCRRWLAGLKEGFVFQLFLAFCQKWQNVTLKRESRYWHGSCLKRDFFVADYEVRWTIQSESQIDCLHNKWKILKQKKIRKTLKEVTVARGLKIKTKGGRSGQLKSICLKLCLFVSERKHFCLRISFMEKAASVYWICEFSALGRFLLGIQ